MANRKRKNQIVIRLSDEEYQKYIEQVEKSKLTIDPEEGKFTLSLTVDENISPISEYFEIFLGRMLLCRRAADYFNMKFEVTINSLKVM